MKTRRRLAFILLLTASAPAMALEMASAQMERERSTSALGSVSLKPLFLFDMRGRRDPFMAYALLTNSVPAGKAFDINELVFSGIVAVDGKTAALFSGDGGKTYFLRGASLFDPGDKVIPGVRGNFAESGANDEVILAQGDRKLSFSYKRLSKRLAVDSQP